MEKLFHKTTWAQVKVGDTVLRNWQSLDEIVEVEVTEASPWEGMFSKPLVRVRYLFQGERYSRVFDPDATVYVQSRF